MKAVVDTLAVARSTLVERVKRRAESRIPYRKAGDDELLALIHRLVDRPRACWPPPSWRTALAIVP